jgi:hypothetical protein
MRDLSSKILTKIIHFYDQHSTHNNKIIGSNKSIDNVTTDMVIFFLMKHVLPGYSEGLSKDQVCTVYS